MKNKAIQIIYLNGPSSSGKTTLARSVQDALEKPYLCIGIDTIIQWMPEKINNWEGGKSLLGYSWKEKYESGNLIQELQIGSYAQKMSTIFRAIVVMLATLDYCLIIDDIAFGKKQIDEWKRDLHSFQVLWIGVNAPLSILEEREKNRTNRMKGSARGQFSKVHLGVTYDLEVDTHETPLNLIVEKIKSLVLASPKK
ncbi:MAG: chloramphenicol phosphotransferase CPT family protein [Chlamydiales bacterium]